VLRTKRSIAIVVVWAVSMLGAGILARQTSQGAAKETASSAAPGQPYGTVITGADLGFQRVGPADRNGTLSGYLVVRVDGQWRPTNTPVQLSR
jgi:hypothetical protein